MNDAIFWIMPWIIEGLKQKVPIIFSAVVIVGVMILLLTFARRLRKKH